MAKELCRIRHLQAGSEDVASSAPLTTFDARFANQEKNVARTDGRRLIERIYGLKSDRPPERETNRRPLSSSKHIARP